MDDLTITTTLHMQARWILKSLGAMVPWTRIVFKPRKSHEYGDKEVTDAFKLQVQDEEIPVVNENPIKCLGKWYDDTFSDMDNITGTEKNEWLRRSLPEEGLPGKINSWIYQHGLLSRLMLLLTVYEIPVPAVKWTKE